MVVVGSRKQLILRSPDTTIVEYPYYQQQQRFDLNHNQSSVSFTATNNNRATETRSRRQRPRCHSNRSVSPTLRMMYASTTEPTPTTTPLLQAPTGADRSEERRVGKECW